MCTCSQCKKGQHFDNIPDIHCPICDLFLDCPWRSPRQKACPHFEPKAATLKDIKRGEYFKLKENGKVYVRDEYDRSTKKYLYYDFDDVNNWHEAKGSRTVIVDFTF